MWEFAKENPGYVFLIVLVLGWVATTPFTCAYKAYRNTLRHRSIALHGWPIPPMDADGDVVYPEEDEE